MKIAVVGCGALGSYYGARLCAAGHDTHFLLRSDYEAVRAEGVFVQSIDGDFHVRPRAARAPQEIGQSEVVLIGLKTTANALLPSLLPPLIGPDTLIVSLQNGLGDEELLAELFGPKNVLGGLCFVCLNRVAPGRIVHTAHGKIVLGEFARASQPRTHALAEAFRAASIPCEVTDNLAQAHWVKLVWNVPFNGLGVAGAAGYEAVVRGALLPEAPIGSCLTTDLLLGDPRWESLVRELMAEVVAAARGHGHEIAEDVINHQVERTRVMSAYKASTLVDFERGQPLEIESMFLEPLRRARAVGVPTPRLEALCGVLTALQLRTSAMRGA